MGFVTKEKLFSKDFFITYGWLLGGCFVFALGAVLFAEPYGFAPGGTYGLSMVFHHLWGWETEIAALGRDVWCENHYLYVCYSGIYAVDSLSLWLRCFVGAGNYRPDNVE